MNPVFALSLVIVAASMASHWYLSRRRLTPAFLLSILSASTAIVSNTLIYLKDHTNSGVLLFHVLAVWQIAMSVRGILDEREVCRV